MAFEKEQREAERFPSGPNVACVFASPVVEDFGPIRIKNISMTGIGLLSNKTLVVGMRLTVKLTNSAKNASRTMLVRVAHVTPQPGGVFLIGGTLDTPLTYEELCLFVM